MPPSDRRATRAALPPEHTSRVPAEVREFVERQLRAVVLDGPFPCLGARSAFRDDSYLFNVLPDLDDPSAAAHVLADLRHFAEVRLRMGDLYTYVVCFLEPRAVTDEAAWDRRLWAFLQSLHDLDDAPWDGRFATDPHDADFALSLAGLGQLVVTLYPGAWRYARRFAWTTLVFNPPEQDRANFPTDEQFLRFQNKIRERDARLQGEVNPSLPATLDNPQAPGFSGARVNPDSWRCPLHVHPDTGRTRDARAPHGRADRQPPPR
ncbi:guanitoxin biosynthesis heme-dependent pre-guanitoxin N-hydroxylase GntA [Streptomyces albidoflavus]|uniref:guanitoxin biosynthesis heme-dependent pre-guanitoxin N-hydroxylase GntA n=1 Tax=Streptomyces albidoflavus TaxID=1886 RepID=UPI0033F39884